MTFSNDAAEKYDPMAETYQRFAEPMTERFAKICLEQAGVKPGQRVLDTAAGTGALALHAAALGAEVMATDISPEMVDRLQQRLKPYKNATAKVDDAERMDIADASFDFAFSCFGATCCQDFERGYREMVRVVRPGGKIVLTHWQTHDGIAGPTIVRVAIDLLRDRFPDLAIRAEAGVPTHSEDTLREDVRAAGCADVTTAVIRAESRWPPADRLIAETEPLFYFLPAYASLTDEQRRLFAECSVPLYARYASGPDGTVMFTDDAIVVTGRRP